MLKNIKPGDWVTQKHWQGNCYLVYSVDKIEVQLLYDDIPVSYNKNNSPFIKVNNIIGLFYNMKKVTKEDDL